MVGALSGGHARVAPSLTLRPSVQRRYSRTRRRKKLRARHRRGRNLRGGQGTEPPVKSSPHECSATPRGIPGVRGRGGAPCKVKCTRALRLPPGLRRLIAKYPTCQHPRLTQTHTAPPEHAHLPPGQPSEQQVPYISTRQTYNNICNHISLIGATPLHHKDIKHCNPSDSYRNPISPFITYIFIVVLLRPQIDHVVLLAGCPVG